MVVVVLRGQILLADIGLSMLEIPEDDGRPADIPQSVRSASPEELDAKPNVLSFLAEIASRRGDLNAAVEFAERAVVSAGDQESASRLALGRLIHRRAAAGDMSSREFRRALSHAQAVMEDAARAGMAPVLTRSRSCSTFISPETWHQQSWPPSRV